MSIKRKEPPVEKTEEGIRILFICRDILAAVEDMRVLLAEDLGLEDSSEEERTDANVPLKN